MLASWNKWFTSFLWTWMKFWSPSLLRSNNPSSSNTTFSPVKRNPSSAGIGWICSPPAWALFIMRCLLLESPSDALPIKGPTMPSRWSLYKVSIASHCRLTNLLSNRLQVAWMRIRILESSGCKGFIMITLSLWYGMGWRCSHNLAHPLQLALHSGFHTGDFAIWKLNEFLALRCQLSQSSPNMGHPTPGLFRETWQSMPCSACLLFVHADFLQCNYDNGRFHLFEKKSHVPWFDSGSIILPWPLTSPVALGIISLRRLANF